MPANYKQRAGRSGRKDQTRSACITICTSDSLGLRTFYSPLETIVKRAVKVPDVDLQSKQVVGRHINSFLLRTFDIFSKMEKATGSSAMQVANYYTRYHYDNHDNQIRLINATVEPDSGLGSKEGTAYEYFNTRCAEGLNGKDLEELNTLLRGTAFEGKIDAILKNAIRINNDCYRILEEKIKFIQSEFISLKSTTGKYPNRLRYQFKSYLSNRLFDFWCNNRFSPNANMPVNVIPFEINPHYEENAKPSYDNPSYNLHEAIRQYMPQSIVVIDGVPKTVGGVRHSSKEQTRFFKKLYRTTEKAVLDEEEPTGALMWTLNNQKALTLIEPQVFLPDPNVQTTRITESPLYSRVTSQLINAKPWELGSCDKLYECRENNAEENEGHILYYNIGNGFGFCFCKLCGRMVPEEEPELTKDGGETAIPRAMNPYYTEEPDSDDGNPKRVRYHRPVDTINNRTKNPRCKAGNDKENYLRNVIIGGKIQTDFSEIRIKQPGDAGWIHKRNENKSLLLTIGLCLTQALAEYLGKNRDELDMLITPDSHICIFDTNPGGAGYSNQLPKLIDEVMKRAFALIQKAHETKSKEMLLSKHSMHYAQDLDMAAALAWFSKAV